MSQIEVSDWRLKKDLAGFLKVSAKIMLQIDLIMNDKITTIFTIRRTIDKLMNDDVIHNYIFKIKVNYFHVLSPQSSQLKNGTKYQH